MAPPPEKARRLLEGCGLRFVQVPAGEYCVGWEGPPPLARPPQHTFLETRATPPGWARTGAFLISAQPVRLSHWQAICAAGGLEDAAGLVTAEQVADCQAQRVDEAEIEVNALFSHQQIDHSSPSRQLPQQAEPDPALEVPPETAQAAAAALGADLPRWREWEIAARGPQALAYPWGGELDLKQLTLEVQDYSVDDESVMGYYAYDQEVYFVRGFGAYAGQLSPFGLAGLARAGREWNLAWQESPLPGETFLQRSLSDLGGMAMMIPGNRPNTWNAYGWPTSRGRLSFSGPGLPCYAPFSLVRKLYPQAAFRLVFRKEESGP